MFYDRVEAGQKLAKELQKYQNKKDVIVLGMPRGGVITAAEVAKGLNIPLDIIVARKIGAPQNPEFAIGAVAETGEPILNEELIGTGDITPDYLDREISNQRLEIKRRLKKYCGNSPHLNLKNKTVILVDDGIATGMSLLAAISQVKSTLPKKIIIAVPVIPQDNITKIKKEVDELVYLDAPQIFYAVGQFYNHFPEVTDEEVKKLLVSRP